MFKTLFAVALIAPLLVSANTPEVLNKPYDDGDGFEVIQGAPPIVFDVYISNQKINVSKEHPRYEEIESLWLSYLQNLQRIREDYKEKSLELRGRLRNENGETHSDTRASLRLLEADLNKRQERALYAYKDATNKKLSDKSAVDLES